MPDPSPHEIAAAWQLQLPGRQAPRDIPDAIVEPAWGGVRVVVARTPDEATPFVRGEVVEVPGDLRRALLEAITAEGAVIEGHLTTEAFRLGEGAMPEPPRLVRPSILVPPALRRRTRDDPAMRSREHAGRELASGRVALEALARGEPHALVATDLLWLDGQSLEDIPLLERKRWLEAILLPSHLVRVTPFVRPTAAPTLATWGPLKLAELSYLAANSRYLAGRENPDWALGRAPDSPPGIGRW